MAKGNEKPGGNNDFTIVTGFTNGYRNREDITVLPPGILVADSQNVLTNTFQRIGIRKGYTLDGEANSDLAPIAGGGPAQGVFDWETSGGGERNMRAGFLTSAANDGKLQFRYVNPISGDVSWVDLVTGLSSVDFNFTTFWDTASLQVLLLCVNGESNIRSWNGMYLSVLSGANPTGIIYQIPVGGEDPDYPENINSGGEGYTVGNILTITGGDGNATLEVLAVVDGAVDNVTVNDGGADYVVNDLFSIDDGDAPLAVGRVDSITGGGVVDTFTILGRGSGYSTGSAVTTTTLSGVGTGLLVDINAVANGAISSWGFPTDDDHGTGYADSTTYPLTGGSGSDAFIRVQGTTSGTITKDGPETWAEAGFTFGGNVAATQEIVIDGVSYTYLSGAFVGDTTTLHGINPDPSGITPGSLAVQGMIVWANTGGSMGLPTDFKNNLIINWDARVFVGSLSSSYLYLSDFASFVAFPVADVIVLNNNLACLVIQQDALYVSSGANDWFQVDIVLSSDLSSRRITVESLNTAAQQGAQGQAATTKIANTVAFLSFEPVIESFGPVANILLGPQMVDLSFPIVNDMNNYDFTGACLFYYRKIVYIAVPRESLVLVYNMTDAKNPYWEAPQVMPIARFSIINGDLYGHSSLVSETYKLFTGTNDNGNPIAANATFSFNNYGTRAQSKGYNEFYVEGYISANTTLSLGIQYDIDGCATNTSFDIDGQDSQIVCLSSDQASLGKTSLGKHPLGSAALNGEDPLRPKFRVIKTFPIRYFYEDQISFSSSGIDQNWEIVGFGPQLLPYGSLNNNITQ